MWPRIIRALLCAATTRAAAATSHVVDDFNTTEGMFTLTSQVPPVSTTEVTETSDGVRLDYSSHHLEMYSGFPYAGRLLGQGNYPCAEASYLKLEYRILQAPARPGVARLVMAVGDASVGRRGYPTCAGDFGREARVSSDGRPGLLKSLSHLRPRSAHAGVCMVLRLRRAGRLARAWG